MRPLRLLLDDLRVRFISAITGREGRTRQITIAALCALCLFALMGTALLFAAQSDPHPATNLAQTSTATVFTATQTPTDDPTATVKPSPTAAVPVTKKVSSKPVSVPPPPPPPPPSTPTATPCPTEAVPTATATPMATATATSAPATTPAPSPAALWLSSCTPCGQNAGNNPSQSQIRAALDSAANLYGLPHNLLYGFAWQESKWHQDVESCDGGVGLMQIQYYYADYFNHSSVLNGSGCGVSYSDYDIYTLSGNANLGAKVIKYLSCYYKRIAADKYQAAGSAFPDTASNPSLCATLYDNNTNGPTATLYQDLPSTVADGWSCPLDPAQGLTSAEVLDYSISAYNAGQTAIYTCSCIPNLGYVGAVEYWTTEFQQGLLP
ncbi:MAG TPA: transglycosylase SLT domain-containing protein [Ktedonobacterales bacterium]|nr:transglycosylase SLT domain-containing protein [Ktedonobacterales bacterium]